VKEKKEKTSLSKIRSKKRKEIYFFVFIGSRSSQVTPWTSGKHKTLYNKRT
jgi:hypothetical protein